MNSECDTEQVVVIAIQKLVVTSFNVPARALILKLYCPGGNCTFEGSSEVNLRLESAVSKFRIVVPSVYEQVKTCFVFRFSLSTSKNFPETTLFSGCELSCIGFYITPQLFQLDIDVKLWRHCSRMYIATFFLTHWDVNHSQKSMQVAGLVSVCCKRERMRLHSVAKYTARLTNIGTSLWLVQCSASV